MNEETEYEITCTHCGNTWIYTGGKKYHATCPDCMRKTKLPKKHPNRGEEEDCCT